MIKKKVLALVLSATIVVTNLPVSKVLAANFTRTTKEKLDLERIKSEAMEIYNSQNTQEGLEESELYNVEVAETYKPNDNVRVIVTLEGSNKSTRATFAKENSEIQTMALEEMEDSNVNFDVRYQFTEEVNTITGDVRYGDIEKIKDLDNVVSVRLAREYTVDLANSNTMIQAQQVWEEYGYKGEGMAVAVLDTGFQIDHPDFVLGEEGKEKAKLTEENLNNVLGNTEVDDIYYNEKIPTGYDWANKDNDIAPLDPFIANHGMHVAGIVGANGDVENGGVKGIAPEVQIIGEKVFSDDGRGYEDDIIAGINHAVEVGADVINMSLGSDCGFVLEDSDLMQISIENAAKEGVLVVVSAGNAYYSTADFYSYRPSSYASNFDIGTVGDPSVSSYALSVASMNNNQITVNIAELSNGEKIEYLNQINLYPVLTEVLGDKEYGIVKIDTLSDKGFSEANCEGKIVLVDASNPYYINASLQSTAKRHGAVGIIAYGEYTNGYNVNSYYGVPVAATNKENGEELIDLLAKDSNLTIKFTNKVTVAPSLDGVETSSFSSWGTTATLDFKPEISGVGGGIYSTTPDGEHTTMSGTSMSSPQIAGAAAILLQSMKSDESDSDFETVMRAKNILMNNTEIIEEIDAGAPYSPRKQGSGLLQLGNALTTPIMIYNADAEMQKRGAIELKEIGSVSNFNLALESLVDEDVNYDLYIDLYTDEKDNEDVDINLDGTIDYNKEINKLQSRKINGAKITIDGAALEDKYSIDINGNKVLNISIDLSNSDVKENSYVEGFITVVPKSENYSEVSIPLMGFYGDWNDAPNIDEPMVGGQPYAEYTAVFGYDSDTPLGFDRLTATINEDKIAFSPKGFENLVGPRFTALRNLKSVNVTVENSDGNIVKELYSDEYLPKNTFYNRNIYYSIADYAPWDGTDEYDNLVEDGIYTFVIKSEFAYEGAETQETKMNVKLDATDPTVSNVNIASVEEGKEITFDVFDETSGFNGAILFIDGEYISLDRGVTKYIVENLPEEVVIIAFDNAGNAGLGVYGDSKEISPDTLLLYFSAAGSYVNYENPCYIYGAAEKSLTWNLNIIGPTGDIIYELDEFEESMFNLQFVPEQGEPNGTYILTGYLLDKPTGIYAKLDEYEINVMDNEICDKSELFDVIMNMKEFANSILIGNEAGQYSQEVVDEFKEVLESTIDIYYDSTTNQEDITSAIELINTAKETLESKVNLSEGKISAIKLLDYCNDLIEEAIVGERPGNYSQESIDTLKESMKYLQELVNSEDEISDDTFNEEIAKLNVSIKAFLDSVILLGDVTDITNLINAQKQYIENIKNGQTQNKYEKDIVETYEALLNEYEEAIKAELTVEEVDLIYKDLNEAVKEFKSKEIDISGLKEAVKNGNSYLDDIKDEKDLYNTEAIEELKAAIEAAETIVSSPYTTEESVNKAITTIKVGIKAVKDSKKDEEKPVEPSDPTNPDNPNDDEDKTEPVNPNKPSKPSDNNKPNKPSNSKLPQTGAVVGSSIIIIGGVLIVGLGTVLLRRKKK